MTTLDSALEAGGLASIGMTYSRRISIRWFFLRWEACIRGGVPVVAPVAAPYRGDSHGAPIRENFQEQQPARQQTLHPALL